MFKVGDYVIYRKDVCIVKDITKNKINDTSYYVLSVLGDDSLKNYVPIDNRCGYLRNIISKDKVMEIISNIPNIDVIDGDNKNLVYEYKRLLSEDNYEGLIKIIKTAYLRNLNRINNKKKLSEQDNYYFELAEKYLYSEFSIALDMSYDDTKKYIIDYVSNKISN